MKPPLFYAILIEFICEILGVIGIDSFSSNSFVAYGADLDVFARAVVLPIRENVGFLYGFVDFSLAAGAFALDLAARGASVFAYDLDFVIGMDVWTVLAGREE